MKITLVILAVLLLSSCHSYSEQRVKHIALVSAEFGYSCAKSGTTLEECKQIAKNITDKVL